MSTKYELLERCFIEASNLLSSLLAELQRIQENLDDDIMKRKIALAINATEKLQQYISSLRKRILSK
ncbi:MAG: hypothetical protein ACTSXJ_04440 [Candidatus Baldrarchaeia archaeon]